MRELDCDFCGGRAAGAYEVLPADLEPTADEQVRVVLCDGCRETLDGVLGPLLDRLGAHDDGGVDSSFADAAAGHAPPDASTAADDTDGAAADRDLAADAAGHAPPPDEESDGAVTADDAADPEESTTGGADEADATAAATDADGGAAATDRAEPDGFRKVMRFLNNREFPVDRAEVSEFAAGAYGLEDDEVREIFDYAIERGVLTEEDGQLVKG